MKAKMHHQKLYLYLLLATIGFNLSHFPGVESVVKSEHDIVETISFASEGTPTDERFEWTGKINGETCKVAFTKNPCDDGGDLIGNLPGVAEAADSNVYMTTSAGCDNCAPKCTKLQSSIEEIKKGAVNEQMVEICKEMATKKKEDVEKRDKLQAKLDRCELVEVTDDEEREKILERAEKLKSARANVLSDSEVYRSPNKYEKATCMLDRIAEADEEEAWKMMQSMRDQLRSLLYWGTAEQKEELMLGLENVIAADNCSNCRDVAQVMQYASLRQAQLGDFVQSFSWVQSLPMGSPERKLAESQMKMQMQVLSQQTTMEFQQLSQINGYMGNSEGTKEINYWGPQLASIAAGQNNPFVARDSSGIGGLLDPNAPLDLFDMRNKMPRLNGASLIPQLPSYNSSIAALNPNPSFNDPGLMNPMYDNRYNTTVPNSPIPSRDANVRL